MQLLTPELKAKIERDGQKIVDITIEDLKNARIFVPTQTPKKWQTSFGTAEPLIVTQQWASLPT